MVMIVVMVMAMLVIMVVVVTVVMVMVMVVTMVMAMLVFMIVFMVVTMVMAMFVTVVVVVMMLSIIQEVSFLNSINFNADVGAGDAALDGRRNFEFNAGYTDLVQLSHALIFIGNNFEQGCREHIACCPHAAFKV